MSLNVVVVVVDVDFVVVVVNVDVVVVVEVKSATSYTNFWTFYHTVAVLVAV